jgi:hypothetical protein
MTPTTRKGTDMGADGAHAGINAGDALKVILGGEPQDEQPTMTADEEGQWLLDAPETAVDWEAWEAEHGDGSAYTECARRVAGACLRVMIADPTMARADRDDDLFKAAKELAPEVCEGLSGFQWGWASNAARRCVEAPPAPNPAIVDVP